MEFTDLNTQAKNILSNTSLIFMPGIHRVDVDTPLIFSNIHHIKLLGLGDGNMRTVAEKVNEYGFDPYTLDTTVQFFESTAKILCDHGKLSIHFVNVSNIEITNLTISNCGKYSSTTLVIASIHMTNVSNVTMERVSIQNSTGYGLWGVNVLGQSQFLYSSFIGNNQYVKGKLIKKIITFPHDDGETAQNTITAYENNGSLSCNSYAGGNFVLFYQNPALVDNKFKNDLLIHSCLFSLAVDVSYALNDLCLDRNGIGLSLIVKQKLSFYLGAKISESTSYRNQAKYGANINLLFDTKSSNVTLERVTSMYGIGSHSGLRVFMLPLQPAVAQLPSSFKIDGSLFKNNYSPSKQNPAIYVYCTQASYTYLTATSFLKSDLGIEAINSNITVLSNFSIFKHCSVLILDSSALSHIVGFNSCYFSHTELSNGNLIMNNHYIQYSDCTLEYSGIAVSSSILALNSCNFIHSRLSAITTSVYLNGTVTFAHNIYNYNGGAMALYLSNATFQASSNVIFMNNSAVNGGSIYMDESSFLVFPSPNIDVKFYRNTAKLAGGAIYAKTLSSSYISSSTDNCFFRTNNNVNIGRIYFEANNAEEAGSVLFGGNIRSCLPGAIKNILIGPHSNSSSLLSSDAVYICHCDYGKTLNESISVTNGTINIYTLILNPEPKCQLPSMINTTVYPGQTIMVPYLASGQAYGGAPALVLLYSNESEIEFLSTQRSIKTCQIYEIKPRLSNGSMYLATETAFSNGLSYVNNLELSIIVLPCPAGFVFNNATLSCVCTSLLQRHKFNCRIENQTLETSGSAWIGFTSQKVLGVMEQCPLDYCRTDGSISATNLDAQCAFSRQGVLCGQCKDGLSTCFGTSQCKQCSNYYLLLIIPFALMGIALVGLLFSLNMTVSSGSLSGIIFYANIVKINDKIFFPTNYANSYSSLFYVFIAWFNLDFGIESCFYNGMDSYAKVWLQFAFPIYIYCLVAVIIIAGRYSSMVSKLCRFNAVSVLATLIQLSYSKVLRVIITIFSSASIDTQDKTAQAVWLYDGHIEYLGSKHIALFSVGLIVLTLLIIPYTLALLFIPCLQSRSHWKFLKWVNILKPFLDCHAAPYKDNYRFWAGVLLVLRLPLYLIFALENSVNVKLLGILIFVTIYSNMLCWLLVYNKLYHNLLEMIFLMNLTAMAIAHLFQPSPITSLSVNIILTVGVGCSFIGFIAILIIHIFIRLEIKCQIWDFINTQRSRSLPTTVLSSADIYTNDNVNKDEDNNLREPALEF